MIYNLILESLNQFYLGIIRITLASLCLPFDDVGQDDKIWYFPTMFFAFIHMLKFWKHLHSHSMSVLLIHTILCKNIWYLSLLKKGIQKLFFSFKCLTHFLKFSFQLMLTFFTYSWYDKIHFQISTFLNSTVKLTIRI